MSAQRSWLGYFRRWWGTAGQQQPTYPIETIDVGYDEPDGAAVNAIGATRAALGGSSSVVQLVATTADTFVERIHVATQPNAARVHLEIAPSAAVGLFGHPMRPGGTVIVVGFTTPVIGWSWGLPQGWIDTGRLLLPAEHCLRVESVDAAVDLEAVFFYREAR